MTPSKPKSIVGGCMSGAGACCTGDEHIHAPHFEMAVVLLKHQSGLLAIDKARFAKSSRCLNEDRRSQRVLKERSASPTASRW